MAWALVQQATEWTWSDYERVAQAVDVDTNPPRGLIVHAAGEVDGKWRSVDVSTPCKTGKSVNGLTGRRRLLRRASAPTPRVDA
jgi:hypothetical protein